MPAFNELGLMSPEHPNSPVPVSFSDSSGGEDSEETEDDDLEEVSPPSQRELLYNLEDDDDTDGPPAAGSPCFVRVHKRSEPAPRMTRASGRAASGRGIL